MTVSVFDDLLRLELALCDRESADRQSWRVVATRI
jgi:hypothetical protein